MDELIKNIAQNGKKIFWLFLPFVLGPMMPILIMAVGTLIIETIERILISIATLFCQIEKNIKKKKIKGHK